MVIFGLLSIDTVTFTIVRWSSSFSTAFFNGIRFVALPLRSIVMEFDVNTPSELQLELLWL